MDHSERIKVMTTGNNMKDYEELTAILIGKTLKRFSPGMKPAK